MNERSIDSIKLAEKVNSKYRSLMRADDLLRRSKEGYELKNELKDDLEEWLSYMPFEDIVCVTIMAEAMLDMLHACCVKRQKVDLVSFEEVQIEIEAIKNILDIGLEKMGSDFNSVN